MPDGKKLLKHPLDGRGRRTDLTEDLVGKIERAESNTAINGIKKRKESNIKSDYELRQSGIH